MTKEQSQSQGVFSKQLEEVDINHQSEMTHLEGQFQQKIMNELERYTSLQQEKEMLNERWDEQNSGLMDSHERVVQVRSSRKKELN